MPCTAVLHAKGSISCLKERRPYRRMGGWWHARGMRAPCSWPGRHGAGPAWPTRWILLRLQFSVPLPLLGLYAELFLDTFACMLYGATYDGGVCIARS